MRRIRRALILVFVLIGLIAVFGDPVPASQIQADTLPHFSEKIDRNVAVASWSVGQYTLTVELFDDITVQKPSGTIYRDEHITILSIRWFNQAREIKLGGSVYLGKDDQVKLPSLNVAAVKAPVPITCDFDVLDCPNVATTDLEWHGSGPLYHDRLSDHYKSVYPSAYCERYDDSYYGVGRSAEVTGSIDVDGQSIDLAGPLYGKIWGSNQVTTGHGTWDGCFH